MTKEELFKRYFPEYVTEKGMCLSPYWDLFSAGVECATFELNNGCIQTLTKENAELKLQIEKMKFEAVKEAFRQGKVIQYNLEGEWVDWSDPTFDDEPCNYRIKEE